MNVGQVFSSQSDDNRHSVNSEGRETVSTETHKTKTKAIRKNYQPLTNEKGKIISFQHEPEQYKRLRKKIQNRQSAARVRGRKKNSYEQLQEEVQHLGKQNSLLENRNSVLENENKNLREQIEYLKTLIKPSRLQDPVEMYLSDDVLTHNHAPPRSPSTEPLPAPEDEDSVMFEEFNFMRTDSQTSGMGWAPLFIFTIILAVFVLPNSAEVGKAAAYQIEGQNQGIPFSTFMGELFEYGKIGIKYSLIVGYILVIYKKIKAYLRGRKFKRI